MLLFHLGHLINAIIPFRTFDKSFKYKILFSDLILYNKVYYYIKHKYSLIYINIFIF